MAGHRKWSEIRRKSAKREEMTVAKTVNMRCRGTLYYLGGEYRRVGTGRHLAPTAVRPCENHASFGRAYCPECREAQERKKGRAPEGLRSICQNLLLDFHTQAGASAYVYAATLQLLEQISPICRARLEAQVVKAANGRFLLYAYQDQEILRGY